MLQEMEELVRLVLDSRMYGIPSTGWVWSLTIDTLAGTNLKCDLSRWGRG